MEGHGGRTGLDSTLISGERQDRVSLDGSVEFLPFMCAFGTPFAQENIQQATANSRFGYHSRSSSESHSRCSTKLHSRGRAEFASEQNLDMGRGKSWSSQSDSALSTAWIDVTNNAIKGTNQTSDEFWEAVNESYAVETGDRTRTFGAAKSRFKEISSAMMKFIGCHKSVLSTYVSGRNEADEMEAAHKLFAAENSGKPFEFVECWKKLKEEPKFRIIYKNEKNKATACPASAASMVATVIGSGEVGRGESTFAEDVRPIGTKRAKREAETFKYHEKMVGFMESNNAQTSKLMGVMKVMANSFVSYLGCDAPAPQSQNLFATPPAPGHGTKHPRPRSTTPTAPRNSRSPQEFGNENDPKEFNPPNIRPAGVRSSPVINESFNVNSGVTAAHVGGGSSLLIQKSFNFNSNFDGETTHGVFHPPFRANVRVRAEYGLPEGLTTDESTGGSREVNGLSLRRAGDNSGNGLSLGRGPRDFV